MIEAPSSGTDHAVANVRAIPFDWYAAGLNLQPLSSVAKIDVEGMELHVLRGMSQSLRQKCFRGVCIELLEENLQRVGTSVANVDTLLRDHGYQPTTSSHPTGAGMSRHHTFYLPA